MRTEIISIGALVTMLTVSLGTPPVSATHCDAVPASVTKTTEKIGPTLCDGSCGALRNLGISGPTPAGAGLQGGGTLGYVDQSHGQCSAATVCPPGSGKFSEGGVWKCLARVSTKAPNPERARCEATPHGRLDAEEIRQLGAMIAAGRPEAELRARWSDHIERGRVTKATLDDTVKAVEAEARQQLDREGARLRTEMARRKAEAQRKAQEEKLNQLGDDAQLANVDLQNMLQKQQQTLQMMSNISKMLYDTAQSVIRKMGG